MKSAVGDENFVHSPNYRSFQMKSHHKKEFSDFRRLCSYFEIAAVLENVKVIHYFSCNGYKILCFHHQ